MTNPPTREGIEAWLRAALAPLLLVAAAEIDGDKSFPQYGLDSMTAITLAADLEVWLGFRLSPTLAWDYPTLNRLSAHIAEVAAAHQEREVVVGAEDADGQLSGLSDAQVDALLRGLLDDGGVRS